MPCQIEDAGVEGRAANAAENEESQAGNQWLLGLLFADSGRFHRKEPPNMCRIPDMASLGVLMVMRFSADFLVSDGKWTPG